MEWEEVEKVLLAHNNQLPWGELIPMLDGEYD